RLRLSRARRVGNGAGAGPGGISPSARRRPRRRSGRRTRAPPRQHDGPAARSMARISPLRHFYLTPADGVKRMKHLAELAIVAALVAGSTDAALAQTIKLATIAPKDSPYYDVLREMGEAWRSNSAGAIELRIYAGGAVGDESDIIRKMRVGQFQAVAVSGGGLADILPELRSLQMPMMFASDGERDYVFDRIHPRLAELAEQRGFKILAWAPTGWLYFFTQKPVIRPDDLRPLGIFAWAGN